VNHGWLNLVLFICYFRFFSDGGCVLQPFVRLFGCSVK